MLLQVFSVLFSNMRKDLPATGEMQPNLPPLSFAHPKSPTCPPFVPGMDNTLDATFLPIDFGDLSEPPSMSSSVTTWSPMSGILP